MQINVSGDFSYGSIFQSLVSIVMKKQSSVLPNRLLLFQSQQRIMCEICSKLTTKTTERRQRRHLLIFLNRFHTLFLCYHCWLHTNKCQLVYWIISLVREKLWVQNKNKKKRMLKTNLTKNLISTKLLDTNKVKTQQWRISMARKCLYIWSVY